MIRIKSKNDSGNKRVQIVRVKYFYIINRY